MTSPLIDASELAAATPDITVLDVRWKLGAPSGHGEYVAGHIPGAAFVDLDSALAGPAGAGGRHPLPDAEVFAEAMRAAGVSAERPVVVYDDWSGLAAARCRWLLRHHGHDDVRLLDGGWAAWVDSGGEVETGGVQPAPGDFEPQPGRLPTADADVIEANLRGSDPAPILVDARAAERFRGEVEPVDPVAGHIPGAVNLPTTDNLTPRGRFRSTVELQERFARAGIVAGADVTVYCGSGVTAAHELLALEVAGIDATLYPGSWSDWVTTPDRPVATGA